MKYLSSGGAGYAGSGPERDSREGTTCWCGHVNPPGQLHCGTCGELLAGQQVVSKPSRPPRAGRSTWRSHNGRWFRGPSECD